MSIFNDKALKGVAEAAAKIMAETSHGLKGNQHKIDANKNGKIDAHDFKLLRAKKGVKEEVEQLDEVGDTPAGRKALGSYVTKAIADKSKDRTKGLRKATSRMYKDDYYGKKNEEVEATEQEQLNEAKTQSKDEKDKVVGAVTKAMRQSYANVMQGRNERAAARMNAKIKSKHNVKEEAELDEAFPTVADAKKRMDAGKTEHGSVTKTATGLVHKRDYKDDDDEDDTPKKKGGYGARQNYKRSTRVNESASFTEMLELYNEHGLKVLVPIETEEMDIDGTTIEVIDADKVNGVVTTEIEEGIMDVAKGAAGVVKKVISNERAYQAQKQQKAGNVMSKLRKEESLSEEPTNDEFTKEFEDQKASFEGKKKQPKVAAGKTTGVKEMPESVEHIEERELTKGEAKKKEDYVMGMKKGLSGFKQRYGERAKSVMYGAATNMAKKD
jgi:hypothetical protein